MKSYTPLQSFLSSLDCILILRHPPGVVLSNLHARIKHARSRGGRWLVQNRLRAETRITSRALPRDGDVQLENVRPGVMTANVQCHGFFLDLQQIKGGRQYGFFFKDWTGQIPSIRGDDRRPTPLDETVGAGCGS